MPEPSIADTRTRIFLLGAVECAAAIFRGPDREGWAALASRGLPELLEHPPAAFPHATAALQKLQRALHPENTPDPDALESEYVRLFVTGPGGAAAPPYESCHQAAAPRTMGQSARDMQRRLAAHALVLDLPSNEPPDHLAVELELLYHLLATAWTRNQPELETEARTFARTITPWLGRFHAALENGGAHPAYLAAAELALAATRTLA
ncbi:MAG: molecular chaperone TorD family protein [Pseudodesulfovibrio sp.]